MDMLDQTTIKPTTSESDDYVQRLAAAKVDAAKVDDVLSEAADSAEAVAEDVKEAASRIDWMKVLGYAAAGVAIAGVGYAYLRSQQKRPMTRMERLRQQLGLAEVDIRDLKSTIRNFDFEELDKSRRRFGTAAKKATHAGAKKVAALTR